MTDADDGDNLNPQLDVSRAEVYVAEISACSSGSADPFESSLSRSEVSGSFLVAICADLCRGNVQAGTLTQGNFRLKSTLRRPRRENSLQAPTCFPDSCRLDFEPVLQYLFLKLDHIKSHLL